MPDVPTLDSRADALAQDSRALHSGLRQQDGELLAAVAGQGVTGALHALVDDRRDLAEAGIAFLVAERIVEGLEAVHVDHQQGER